MSRKEYFAYGSNLNFEQMAYRCPEATVIGTAKLDGYELAFRRGYLTILPKEGATVEGLIWSVTDHDESQLDCYEGYPTFYNKETMTVTDADGKLHEIMVYTMNEPYRDQLLPVSSRYNAVVIQGCLDAGISPQQFYTETWEETSYEKDGSYLLLPAENGTLTFFVEQTEMNWTLFAIGMAIAALMLIFAFIMLWNARHKKGKKK